MKRLTTIAIACLLLAAAVATVRASCTGTATGFAPVQKIFANNGTTVGWSSPSTCYLKPTAQYPSNCGFTVYCKIQVETVGGWVAAQFDSGGSTYSKPYQVVCGNSYTGVAVHDFGILQVSAGMTKRVRFMYTITGSGMNDQNYQVILMAH